MSQGHINSLDDLMYWNIAVFVFNFGNSRIQYEL